MVASPAKHVFQPTACATHMAREGAWSSMHMNALAKPSDCDPHAVHGTRAIHGLALWSLGARLVFYQGLRCILHDIVIACISSKDLMATKHYDFNLDLIHMILDVFDDDWVARSLLWIKQS